MTGISSFRWQPIEEKENWIPITIFPKNVWEFTDNNEKESMDSHEYLLPKGYGIKYKPFMRPHS